MGFLHHFVLFLFLVCAVKRGESAHGSPPKILESVERKFRIPVGQKLFRIVCPVIAGEKEMLMVEWEKNGEQIQWDSRYKLARDNKELRMKNVRLEDSGRYQCQATNGFGHQTVDFTVHVYDPDDTGVSVKDKLVLSNSTSAPNWLIDMEQEWSSPVQVNRGGRLELHCPARGNPMPEIRWYKNNMLLASDAPPHIATFAIDPANPEDSGDYRCLVENRLGSIDAVFKVTVGDFFEDTHHSLSDNPAGPEPEIDVPYNVTVEVGHTAQFQCKAKAMESPLIKWLKEVTDPVAVKRSDPNATIVSANGMHLLVLDQNQVESVTRDAVDNQYINRLVIPAVTKTAAGKYICVVTSSQGHIVYKSAQLNVVSTGLDLTGFSTSQIVWVMVALGVVIFIFIVACAVIMLKRFQEPSSPEKFKQPPPPKLPLPAAPAPYSSTLNRSFNQDFEKGIRSPVLLNNSMFQQKLPLGGTLDRRTYLRSTRGYDEMSHVYDCSSPQPQHYWGVRHQPIYPPPSSNYKTLEVALGRNHPSICSEEYAEQEPFIHYPRR